MSKFFVKTNQVEGNLIRIEGTDVNHIKNVLRQKEGDEIVICDSEKQKNYFSLPSFFRTKRKIRLTITKKEPVVTVPDKSFVDKRQKRFYNRFQ
mgnify:CR=1 FL=1